MRVTQMSASNRPEKARVVSAPAPPMVQKENSRGIGGILSDLKKDDYILIGIIAALIFEGCDDYVLLAVLGYLFIMGINFEKK